MRVQAQYLTEHLDLEAFDGHEQLLFLRDAAFNDASGAMGEHAWAFYDDVMMRGITAYVTFEEWLHGDLQPPGVAYRDPDAGGGVVGIESATPAAEEESRQHPAQERGPFPGDVAGSADGRANGGPARQVCAIDSQAFGAPADPGQRGDAPPRQEGMDMRPLATASSRRADVDYGDYESSPQRCFGGDFTLRHGDCSDDEDGAERRTPANALVLDVLTRYDLLTPSGFSDDE